MLLISMQEARSQEAHSNPVATFHRLSAEQRWLLLRAACVLSSASAIVALLPFRRAVSFGSVTRRKKRGPTVSNCVWAVKAAAKRLPWRTKCIEQGLAAQRMLRQTGVDAVLHYGARHDPHSGRLEAHVWVSVAGETIIGGEDASGFAEIAAYP
jgi:hypothetical protein